MRRISIAAITVATVLAFGASFSVAAEPGAKQSAPPAAAQSAPDNKAVEGGGCMPDGSCCGNGACAQAAQDKGGNGAAAGGCPCSKRRNARKKK